MQAFTVISYCSSPNFTEQSDIHEVKYLQKAPGERTSILTKCYLIPKFYPVHSDRDTVVMTADFQGSIWSDMLGEGGRYGLSWSRNPFLTTSGYKQPLTFPVKSPGNVVQGLHFIGHITIPRAEWFKNWGGEGRIWAQRIWGGRKGTQIQLFFLNHCEDLFIFSDKVA